MDSDEYFQLSSGTLAPLKQSLANLDNAEDTYQNSPCIYEFSKNYDQPWDLSQIQQNLEDKFQHLMNDKMKNQLGEFTNHKLETKDLRSQDEYDKPWDLRPHKKDERSQEGYDRPWDLKQQYKDNRPTEEYDIPWDRNAQRIKDELEAAHKKSMRASMGGSLSTVSLKEQNMSKSSQSIGEPFATKYDSRGSEEYDEPWDQKMKNIVSQAIKLTNQNKVLVIAAPKKSGFGIKSKNFDIKIPLEGQSWYHGIVGRTQAENILRSHQEGSYLVRISETSHKDYSLSVKSVRGFMHMKITRQDGSFVLGQFSQPFQSIPQMIHHYTINKLPIKGAEHIFLAHPVPHECL